VARLNISALDCRQKQVFFFGGSHSPAAHGLSSKSGWEEKKTKKKKKFNLRLVFHRREID